MAAVRELQVAALDDLSPLEVELLEEVAAHEEETGRPMSRATLSDEFALEFGDVIRVLLYLRDRGYLVVERGSIVSDKSQVVMLTRRGASRLEVERSARVKLARLGVRSRVSDLGA